MTGPCHRTEPPSETAVELVRVVVLARGGVVTGIDSTAFTEHGSVAQGEARPRCYGPA